MNRLNSPVYATELDVVCSQNLPWTMLSDKTVAITGATGMVGSFLIDALMRKNTRDGLNCRVLALGRSTAKAQARLPYCDNPLFSFEEINVSQAGSIPSAHTDFILHLASATHPKAYATDPIGTIEGNVNGLSNMLRWADSCGATLLFSSSVEVYGENRGDTERFTEDYCGYLDCNTLRAGYNESKRLGEAMCQAWRVQKNVTVHIARLARIYGPTLQADDSKALSQFLHKALNGEDVVVKSQGTQRYSYLHVADAVSGLLSVMLTGKNGEAYNLADSASDTTLRNLAHLVADAAGVNLVFDVPDATEAAGYSTATLALMDATKANTQLGWRAQIPLDRGIPETLHLLREAAQ